MEVILDELTPMEFFNHGGIVKMTISDDIADECEIKRKYTFFDYKEYIRFLKNLYMIYIHKHSEKSAYELYKYINTNIKLEPSIGKSAYVVDLEYDQVRTYETSKFYYAYDKREKEPELSPKDPYGIRNVNFTLIDETDDRWKEFEKQRLERGFDDSELWNLDGTLAKFIYPRLKAFQMSGAGICHPYDMAQEEWDSILKKMVDGFELLSSDRIKNEEEENIVNEALDLFTRYFCALWV